MIKIYPWCCSLPQKSLLPSAAHLEERLTIIQQLVSHTSSQSDSHSGKEAGRKKHTVWVFLVGDSATSDGGSSNYQNKQWSNGNAAD